MNGFRGRVAGATVLAASLACALSGCQLGDYTAVPRDCEAIAGPFTRWLADQPLVTSATVVSAEAVLDTDSCDLTVRAVVPDSATKARFLPLGRAIQRRLPAHASTTVEIAHGESTEFVDFRTELDDISW